MQISRVLGDFVPLPGILKGYVLILHRQCGLAMSGVAGIRDFERIDHVR